MINVLPCVYKVSFFILDCYCKSFVASCMCVALRLMKWGVEESRAFGEVSEVSREYLGSNWWTSALCSFMTLT